MSKLEATYNRIVAIRNNNYERKDSMNIRQVGLLFDEYLIRLALWAERLDAPNTWPLTDIAGLISPTVEVPQQYIDKLEKMRFKLSERIFITNALKWSTLIDQQKIPDHLTDLPSPFEPLILFFENQGSVSSLFPSLEIVGFGILDDVRNQYSRYLTKKPHDIHFD